MAASQFVHRGPLLPLPADVLALLGADDARCRRGRGFFVLNPASGADEACHGGKVRASRKAGDQGFRRSLFVMAGTVPARYPEDIMAVCEVCGNDYYLSFQVVAAGHTHTF